MYKYCFRIIHSDFKSWLPLIGVVSFVSFLVGNCAYQMAWSYSDKFIKAVESQGFSVSEFHIVSQTIYIVVFSLAFFSLTIVGNSTVKRTQATFAQWKLIGASLNDVRNCLLVMMLYISLLGSLPGSLFSLIFSYYTVPIYNKMAAQGFSPGTDIALPSYSPSYAGFLLTVALSILTCCGGTALTIYKSGKTSPIDILKNITQGNPQGNLKTLRKLSFAVTLFLMTIFIIAALNFPLENISIEVLFNASLQSGILAILAVYFSIPLIVIPMLNRISKIILELNQYKFGIPFSSVVDKLHVNHYSLTCLFVGVSGITIISTVIKYSLNVLSKYGVHEINSLDTLVLTVLFSSTCLIVSVAIMQLNTYLIREDQKLLRVSGYTPRELIYWHVLTSLIQAALAIILSLFPLTFTSTISTVMTYSITGEFYIYFPWVEIFSSFLVCWLISFSLNILNSLSSLREDIGAQLR